MTAKRVFWVIFFVILGVALAFSIIGEMKPKEEEKQYENIEDYLEEDNYPFNDPFFSEGKTTLTASDLTAWIRQRALAVGLDETSSVEITKEGRVTLRTAITDPDALAKHFPQAKDYTSVISLVKGREILVTFVFTEDEKGNVGYDISSLSVSGVTVDGSMVTPYLAASDVFSALEKIPFSDISFSDGRVTFNGEAPAVLG